MEFYVFDLFYEFRGVFTGEWRVSEERTKERNKEGGEALLGACAVGDDVPGWVVFIRFMCFDERICRWSEAARRVHLLVVFFTYLFFFF